MNKAKPLNRAALKSHPLPPVIDGDKKSKGRILIVAGSREVPGAALLAGIAAMRAGAGKLRISTLEILAPQLGLIIPEALTVGLPEDSGGGFATAAVKRITKEAANADAVVAGPGVKRNGACEAIGSALLKTAPALALDVAFLETLSAPAQPRPIAPILLPNADELTALLECDPAEIEREPVRCGLRAAELYRAIVLVKGVVSHVVAPDGQAWTYRGGAPGLGVSGSGDVLAGIVGGLLARGADPLSALLWTVWLHGEAGARLARKVGPIGFLAREIADEIPALLPR